ncbi:MAG: hypothetical protein LRY46_00165 [Candidatus Pacebacteria bacterium]|nr:hypothetical protein [Candidatus Paceibacterota bacterium]
MILNSGPVTQIKQGVLKVTPGNTLLQSAKFEVGGPALLRSGLYVEGHQSAASVVLGDMFVGFTGVPGSAPTTTQNAAYLLTGKVEVTRDIKADNLAHAQTAPQPVCTTREGWLVPCATPTPPPDACPSGNCTPTAMSGCSARPTSGGNPHWVVACTTPSKNADGTDVTQYEVQEFIHFEGNFLPYTQQYAGNHYQNGEVFMAGGISGTLNPYRGIILRGRGINSFGAGTWTYFEGSPNATYSIDSFANTNINFNQNNASSLNFAVNWNAYAQIRQSAGLPMGRFVIARCPQGSCTITQTFGGGTTTTVTGTLTIAGIYPFTGSNINQNIAFSTLGGNVGDRYVLYFALPGVNPTVGATFQGGSASYRLESFIERY